MALPRTELTALRGYPVTLKFRRQNPDGSFAALSSPIRLSIMQSEGVTFRTYDAEIAIETVNGVTPAPTATITVEGGDNALLWEIAGEAADYAAYLAEPSGPGIYIRYMVRQGPDPDELPVLTPSQSTTLVATGDTNSVGAAIILLASSGAAGADFPTQLSQTTNPETGEPYIPAATVEQAIALLESGAAEAGEAAAAPFATAAAASAALAGTHATTTTADRNAVAADRLAVEGDAADVAADKADVAADRALAETAADEAQAAALAMSGGSIPFFLTEAAGIAGVADGEVFQIPVADSVASIDIRQRVGSGSISLGTIASGDALQDEIDDRTTLISEITDGAAIVVADSTGAVAFDIAADGTTRAARFQVPGGLTISVVDDPASLVIADASGGVVAELTADALLRVVGLAVGYGMKIGVVDDPGVALAIVDSAGGVIADILTDGTFRGGWAGGGGSGGEASTAEEVTVVGDFETRGIAADESGRIVNQVWLREAENVYRAITGGPYSTRHVGLDSIDGNIATLNVYRQGAAAKAKYRITPLGSTALSTPRRLYLGLYWGQSLIVALIESPDRPDAPWTGIVPGNAWMFDGANVDGLPRGSRPAQYSPQGANKNLGIDPDQFARIIRQRAAQHAYNGINGQTPAETAALALMGQHLQPADHILSTVIGTGATAIASFLPGAAHNDSLMAAIDAAAARRDAMNDAMAAGATPDRWELHVFSASQIGEQDTQDNTPEATIISRMEAVIDSISDKVAAVGGTFIKHFILATMYSEGGTDRRATIAQGEMGKTGTAVVIPTHHLLPGGRSAHLMPLTYLPQGSALAHAVAEVIADPAYELPHVKDGDAVLTSATTTVCAVSGGNGSLVFDILTIPNRPDGNYGVTMTDDDGDIAVSAVAITGPAEITITHAATAIVDNPMVKFGLDGGALQLPDANGPRVNIRDTSDWPCAATGQTVSGFMFPHQTALTAP